MKLRVSKLSLKKLVLLLTTNNFIFALHANLWLLYKNL